MNSSQKCEVLQSVAVYSEICSKTSSQHRVSLQIVFISDLSFPFYTYLLIFIFPIILCIFNLCSHSPPFTFVPCISISILALHYFPPVPDLTIRSLNSASGFIEFRPRF